MGVGPEEKPRKNGFERPFHPLQIVSWLVFGANCLIFCTLGIPLIKTFSGKLVAGVPFVLSVAVLVRYAWQATICDPADPHLYMQVSDPQMADEHTSTLQHCKICDMPVFARTKHCRSCKKCIRVFDHHCIWLNNCIGEYNYRAFAVCLASVAVITCTCLATCVYLLAGCLVEGEAFAKPSQYGVFFVGIPKGRAAALLGVMILVNLPLFVLDIQLIVLHWFLTSQQLTTYDYIVKKKKQQDEKKAAQSQPDNAAPPAKIGRALPGFMDWIVFRPSGKPSLEKRPDPSSQEATSPEATVINTSFGESECDETEMCAPASSAV